MQMQSIQAQMNRGSRSFSRDMTDSDLSSHLQPVTATGGIHVNFFYRKVRIKTRNAAVNGQVETRLCVSKQPKGDRSTVAVRYINEEQAQRMFPREFALFKQYEEVPTSGTPLDELPGISMSQIGLLVLNGLRCIEDLVEVSSDQINQIGLDAVRAQKVAMAWSEKLKGSAEDVMAADIEARFQLQLDAMKKQYDAMTMRNTQLEAEVSALQRAHAGGNQAAVTVNDPVDVASREDLEYDISNMADPMSEGPATSDGVDDLGADDPDPLAEA